MIVRTRNGVYEVDRAGGRFRRAAAAFGEVPDGGGSDWQRFDQVGPVVVGEPLRLTWLIEERGRVAHVGSLVTSPVVEVTEPVLR